MKVRAQQTRGHEPVVCDKDSAMTTIENSRIDELRQAIAALEAQRELLGDAVVDASVEALNKQLANETFY